MRELEAIVSAWRTRRHLPDSPVLATVVHVKGSAYRRPGARMLMFPDGSRIGSISGGCLEGDVSKKAWWLTENGRPALRTYDTASDDDAIWEFGLGCNGVVRVLLERLDSPSTGELMQFLDERLRSRTEGAVAVVIAGPAPLGSRLYIAPDGGVRGDLKDSPLASEIGRQAFAAMAARESRVMEADGCEIFLERIAPPLPLVIFGAGHDAIPLVAIAKELGWHVTVADGRPAYAKAARFRDADEVILLTAEDPAHSVPITRDSAVVLMTHNYPQDRAILRSVLPLKPRYLGLLGPRARTERLLAEMVSTGTADLHAPAGLDIGADTPEAIALSIASEIQAVIAGRSGSMLRTRQAPIYDPLEEVYAGLRQACSIARA